MERREKTAVILGCSHAAGAEIEQDPTVDLGELEPDQFGYWNSYPAQLARLMGYQHIRNHAVSGGSNDAIFRIFEEYVNPYKHHPRPDLVIACWTGGERSEIWHYEEQAWQGLAAGKQRFFKKIDDPIVLEGRPIGEGIEDETAYVAYQKQWVTFHCDRWCGRINKIKNIIALNGLAQQYKIPVINIDSFDTIQEHEFDPSVYYPVHPAEFSGWAANSGFKATGNGHYFLKPHTLFAKFLYKKIDIKYHAYPDTESVSE